MHRIPETQVVVKLLGRFRVTLGTTQNELAKLLGVTRRTVGRWEAGASAPSIDQLRHLARAVHSKDPALAEALATEGDATLETLGLRSPAPSAPRAPAATPAPSIARAPAPPAAAPSALIGPPPRPFPPVALLIDSIVHVAARALDGEDPGRDPVAAITAVLRIAFARASALGLTVDEVDSALSPRSKPTVAETPVAPKRQRVRSA
jgi:transcriptional regulator with XRE-family HTH domain